MQFVAFDVADDFAVEVDLVQVAAAVIKVVDLAAVGQYGGGAVAVEVVMVVDTLGDRLEQHIVLRVAPVGVDQAVLLVLFLGRYLPPVLADELASCVVVETGNAVPVGGTDEVTVKVVMIGGFLNVAFVVVGKGLFQTVLRFGWVEAQLTLATFFIAKFFRIHNLLFL